jgi:hypothetical protein
LESTGDQTGELTKIEMPPSVVRDHADQPPLYTSEAALTRINGAEPASKSCTHPQSGEKWRRQSLVACRSGRLALKRCPHSGGFNLYWLANGGRL